MKRKLRRRSVSSENAQLYIAGNYPVANPSLSWQSVPGYAAGGIIITKRKERKVMSKVAVVYWSGTGNTEAMAYAVEEGAKDKGAEVSFIQAADFSADQVSAYDAIAFGCPAMGDEVLEESEFDPMFTDVEAALSGKKVALFGSYGWGDGQWMRDWEDRCRAAGAELVTDSVTANDAPGDEETELCKALGAAPA
jgi:flavodoxin short chain